jgi:parvulin-like peptidyl-prolyl isomerase
MGWLRWKDIPREVANVAFRLDVGGATDIFPANDGYHIFYLAEVQPLGASIELLSARSRRFVRAMEEERLQRELREELASRYDVRFREGGLARGLKTFAIAFAGERPPDTLMAGVILEYPLGQVTVGNIFSMYYALPENNRPYLGDYQGLSDFSLDMILPELQALAGYEMGLGRSLEARFAARKAREEALISLMEDDFKSQIEITQRDIEDYYAERSSDLFEPSRYHGSRILVSSMEAARQAYQQLMMGADFADVAMQVSEDEVSSPYGGDIGWISEGIVAVYDSVLVGMNPGDFSRPFKTLSGFEIFKLIEREERRYLSLEEATPNIKMFITNTRANEMLETFVSGKIDAVGFYVNEDLLRSIRLPEPEYGQRQAREAEAGEEEEKAGILPKID